MKTLSVKSDFNNEIQKGLVLVDFGAPWCAPCKKQEEILNSVSHQVREKASILSINIDDNMNIAGAFFIQSIPTLIIFKDGIEIERFIGLQPEETIIDALEKS